MDRHVDIWTIEYYIIFRATLNIWHHWVSVPHRSSCRQKSCLSHLIKTAATSWEGPPHLHIMDLHRDVYYTLDNIKCARWESESNLRSLTKTAEWKEICRVQKTCLQHFQTNSFSMSHLARMRVSSLSGDQCSVSPAERGEETTWHVDILNVKIW